MTKTLGALAAAMLMTAAASQAFATDSASPRFASAHPIANGTRVNRGVRLRCSKHHPRHCVKSDNSVQWGVGRGSKAPATLRAARPTRTDAVARAQ
ncbi:MAG: hypothetical protein ACHP7N_10020 [Caulobacterales bacterium]